MRRDTFTAGTLFNSAVEFRLPAEHARSTSRKPQRSFSHRRMRAGSAALTDRWRAEPRTDAAQQALARLIEPASVSLPRSPGLHGGQPAQSCLTQTAPPARPPVGAAAVRVADSSVGTISTGRWEASGVRQPPVALPRYETCVSWRRWLRQVAHGLEHAVNFQKKRPPGGPFGTKDCQGKFCGGAGFTNAGTREGRPPGPPFPAAARAGGGPRRGSRLSVHRTDSGCSTREISPRGM